MNTDTISEIINFMYVDTILEFSKIFPEYFEPHLWINLLSRDFNISVPNLSDPKSLYESKYDTQLEISNTSKRIIDDIINGEAGVDEYYFYDDKILNLINNAIVNNETILFPLYIMVGYEGENRNKLPRENSGFNVVNINKGLLDIRFYIYPEYIAFKDGVSKTSESSFIYLQQILFIPALYKVLNRNIVDKEYIGMYAILFIDDEYKNPSIQGDYIFFYNGEKFYPIKLGYDNIIIPQSLQQYMSRLQRGISHTSYTQNFNILDDDLYKNMIIK